MLLKTYERKGTKKSETKKIRHDKNIPSVAYGVDGKSRAIFVKGDEFDTIMRTLPKGMLATTVFDLDIGSETKKAIVKGIEYHRTTYAIEHLDFKLIDPSRPLTVNVPIQLTHVPDCVGAKLGGFLRQVIRSVKVRTLLADLPQKFEIDVMHLNIGDSKRLSDIAFSEKVRPMVDLKEVAVIVAKR